MTDDSPTAAAELASAALDNEVTSAERVLVAGSPALTAEMGVYAEIRTWLAAVDVPATARENALAAALAAFDEIRAEPSASPATLAATPVGVVTLGGRRPRPAQWLKGLAAAAAVAAIVVGAVALLGRGGNDTKSSATLSVAAKQSSAQVGSTGSPVATHADAAPTAASAAGATPASTASVSPWPTAPMLNSDDAVVAFVNTPGFGTVRSAAAPAAGAADTTAASTAGAPLPAATGGPAIPCVDGDGPAAFAYYKGRRAVVLSDTESRLISVIDADTCGLITTIPMP
jgi:hypothetical protein